MFTINTSPQGQELEEGIRNELCRILEGARLGFLCMCFSIPSFGCLQEHGKNVSNQTHCFQRVATHTGHASGDQSYQAAL